MHIPAVAHANTSVHQARDCKKTPTDLEYKWPLRLAQTTCRPAIISSSDIKLDYTNHFLTKLGSGWCLPQRIQTNTLRQTGCYNSLPMIRLITGLNFWLIRYKEKLILSPVMNFDCIHETTNCTCEILIRPPNKFSLITLTNAEILNKSTSHLLIHSTISI